MEVMLLVKSVHNVVLACSQRSHLPFLFTMFQLPFFFCFPFRLNSSTRLPVLASPAKEQLHKKKEEEALQDAAIAYTFESRTRCTEIEG